MLVVVKIYSQRPTGPVDTVRRRRPIDNVDPPSQLTLAPAVPAATQADPSHSPISRTAKALVQESTTRDSPTAWDPKVSTGRPEYVTFSAVIVYCDRRLGSTAVVSVALALVGQKIVAGRRRKSSFSSRHTTGHFVSFAYHGHESTLSGLPPLGFGPLRGDNGQTHYSLEIGQKSPISRESSRNKVDRRKMGPVGHRHKRRRAGYRLRLRSLPKW